MTQKDLEMEFAAHSGNSVVRPEIGRGKIDKDNLVIIDPSLYGIMPDGEFENNFDIKTIVIPEGVKQIGAAAFKNCTNLETVHIPKSLVRICDCAFVNCHNLRNINIGLDKHSNLREIDSLAFYGCYRLGILQVWNDQLQGYALLHGDVNDGEGIIPDGVVLVSGFSSFKSLRSIDVPAGVRIIDMSAFSGCMNLEHVELPSTVECIEMFAFCCCRSLSEIIIPENTRNIGYRAFESCDSLTDIVIPSGVRWIGSFAFEGCRGLRSVRFEGILSESEICLFEDCPNLRQVIANKETMELLNNSGSFKDISENCELVIK